MALLLVLVAMVALWVAATKALDMKSTSAAYSATGSHRCLPNTELDWPKTRQNGRMPAYHAPLSLLRPKRSRLQVTRRRQTRARLAVPQTGTNDVIESAQDNPMVVLKALGGWVGQAQGSRRLHYAEAGHRTRVRLSTRNS